MVLFFSMMKSFKAVVLQFLSLLLNIFSEERRKSIEAVISVTVGFENVARDFSFLYERCCLINICKFTIRSRVNFLQKLVSIHSLVAVTILNARCIKSVGVHSPPLFTKSCSRSKVFSDVPS